MSTIAVAQLRALDHALETWIRAAPGRGLVTWPIDVLIDERNVFGPDLLWYADGRSPARDTERPYPMPDLAVEARSLPGATTSAARSPRRSTSRSSSVATTR